MNPRSDLEVTDPPYDLDRKGKRLGFRPLPAHEEERNELVRRVRGASGDVGGILDPEVEGGPLGR